MNEVYELYELSINHFKKNQNQFFIFYFFIFYFLFFYFFIFYFFIFF